MSILYAFQVVFQFTIVLFFLLSLEWVLSKNQKIFFPGPSQYICFKQNVLTSYQITCVFMGNSSKYADCSKNSTLSSLVAFFYFSPDVCQHFWKCFCHHPEALLGYGPLSCSNVTGQGIHPFSSNSQPSEAKAGRVLPALMDLH